MVSDEMIKENQRKIRDRPRFYRQRPEVEPFEMVAGTTHIVMSPQEFVQRAAARVPHPRLHLIRFHGVLAPRARLRVAVVPGRVEKE